MVRLKTAKVLGPALWLGSCLGAADLARHAGVTGASVSLCSSTASPELGWRGGSCRDCHTGGLDGA